MHFIAKIIIYECQRTLTVKLCCFLFFRLVQFGETDDVTFGVDGTLFTFLRFGVGVSVDLKMCLLFACVIVTFKNKKHRLKSGISRTNRETDVEINQLQSSVKLRSKPFLVQSFQRVGISH